MADAVPFRVKMVKKNVKFSFPIIKINCTSFFCVSRLLRRRSNYRFVALADARRWDVDRNRAMFRKSVASVESFPPRRL